MGVLATNPLQPVMIHTGVNPNLKTFVPDSEGSYDPLVDTFITDVFNNNYPPSFTGVNSDGVLATTFKDDFYFKIRYLPTRLDLGSLTGGQLRDLHVFNGFFDDRPLSAITLTNGTGISIGPPTPPTTFNPLQLQLYQVTVTVDGPATIDATINFDWAAPTEDGSVSVTGSRIVTFPYLFSTGATETLSWSTDLITKQAGVEQRVRTRNAPRQAFSINAFIPMNQLTTADNLLYGWRGNTWGLPLFSECRFLTGTTSTTSTTVPVNTDNAEFRVGELAIIWQSESVFELIQISSFTTTTITAAQNITRIYNTNALVAPVIPCRMVSDPVRRTTGYDANVTASFESVQNRVLAQVAAAPQYLGFDVYTDQPLLAGTSSPDTYNTRVDVLDFTAPNAQTFNVWDSTKVSRQFEVELTSTAELWNFRLWLHRRSGRLVPFWMPTFEANFNLISTGLIESQFTVVNEGQAAQGQTRIHVAVRTTSSTWIFAEIQTLTEVNNTVEVILTAPLNIQADTIEYISYLGLKRLASDRVEIRHESNFVSVCRLSITEIDQ